ncbi:MAG: hypothetical protein U0871_09495 [Gemmataceae bacterium]
MPPSVGPAGPVRALRAGTRFVLDPTTPAVLAAVAPALTYTARVPLAGYERMAAVRAGRPPFDTEDRRLYALDARGRLATTLGNWERVRDALARAGLTARLETIARPPRPQAYVAHWDRLKGRGITFRHKQLDALRLMAAYPTGRVDCPTAFGKSWLIGILCLLFPEARMAVTTRSADVLGQRIYPALCGLLPDVGIRTGGKKSADRRVMCYTADSLHNCPPDIDWLLFDEVHEAAADSHMEDLARFHHARMWGFSASHDCRQDGLDARVEAVFGPVRLRVSYEEGVAHGMITPIRVEWGDVPAAGNPCQGIPTGDSTARKRAGRWAHEARHRAIAADARRYGPGVQTLITVSTIEHALHLRRLLPEFELVYRADAVGPEEQAAFARRGLWPADLRPLDDARKAALTAAFEAGRLTKAIATTVWNRGVDFGHLAVLLRGDAGRSGINDRQVPGRTSRRPDLKDVSVVHDYTDRFDPGMAAAAGFRSASYRAMGWEQVFPPSGPPQPVRRPAAAR